MSQTPYKLCFVYSKVRINFPPGTEADRERQRKKARRRQSEAAGWNSYAI